MHIITATKQVVPLDERAQEGQEWPLLLKRRYFFVCRLTCPSLAGHTATDNHVRDEREEKSATTVDDAGEHCEDRSTVSPSGQLTNFAVEKKREDTERLLNGHLFP